MNQSEKERLQACLKWVTLYEDIKDAGIVCRGCGISRPTLRKWLKRNNIPYLQKKRAYRKRAKGYNCKIPGERIQMDVCKIAAGIYQYTAIDDCTRYKVLAIYKRRTAKNTTDFLEDQVFYRMPFPFQRIQTDRGKEFMAYEVQEKLMEWGIKFRHIKPASPHLNGKVERSQRTDLDEFYSSVDIKDPNLESLLSDWEFYYNCHRPHSSLNGKTPNEKYSELIWQTPLWEEIEYDPKKERIIPSQNFKADSYLQKLKRCL